MIWSFVKLAIFFCMAAALAFGLANVVDTPGEVRVVFGSTELSVSPLTAIIGIVLLFLALWVLFVLAGLVLAFIRMLAGDETALSRYFDRNRERRGFEALTDSMIALAAGDGRKATNKAHKAEKYLAKPELTRLVNAQAAEMTGDTAKALVYYKEMVADERTRFVGVRGLMKQKLAEGDTNTALKLAQKAFALEPKHTDVLNTLFDLQSEKSDWTGARKTLEAKLRARALPKDVVKRRDAVLSLADARDARAVGDVAKAREAALQANRIAPSLVPAAVLAAELQSEADNARAATKIIKAAWSANPHPDLAAAFAAIVPDETPDARQKRFDTLFRQNPKAEESALVASELALAAEDFPGARRALGSLAEDRPTTRSLSIMAAIERGEGGEEAVVRGWLAKALSAPRGKQWVCSNCNHIHAVWQPICENCNAFDTAEWADLPAPDLGSAGAAMLPVIVGAIDKKPDEPVMEEVELEAELVEAPAAVEEKKTAEPAPAT